MQKERGQVSRRENNIFDDLTNSEFWCEGVEENVGKEAGLDAHNLKTTG